ncbi:MAG: alpha/beta fold hydrolase [Candidatus Nanopelagicales bacterium]
MRVRTSDGVGVVFDDVTLPASVARADLPVVLLHGLSQQRHYWSPVMSRMSGIRVIAIDQRCHGDASVDEDGRDVSVDTDVSMTRLATDVVEVLDACGVDQAIVVGHSWGASVALRAAALFPLRVRAAALIDGGLFGPRHLLAELGDQEAAREALRPPPLGMLAPVLWEAISTGDLSPYWGQEVQAALEPTFRTDSAGRVFTRIGMDRHMSVLDAMFDYDPAEDIAAVGCPVWAVVCEPPTIPDERDPDRLTAVWAAARASAIAELPAPFFVQRWYRALHDVPLQWPALVAGLVQTIAERTRA